MLHRIITRTSPFGYYATCSCGHITRGGYSETARDAFYASKAEHVPEGHRVTGDR